MKLIATILQTIVGLSTPLVVLRLLRFLFAKSDNDSDEPKLREGDDPKEVAFGGPLAIGIVSFFVWMALIGSIFVGVGILIYLSGIKMERPVEKPETDSILFFLGIVKAIFFNITGMLAFVLTVFALTDWPFYGSFRSIRSSYRPLDEAITTRIKFVRGIYSLIGTLFVLGLSVLPLTALIVALPAVSPNEAVLTDTVRPATSWLRRMFRRIGAILAGCTVTIVLLAISIEVVSLMGLPERGRVGPLMEKALGIAVFEVKNTKDAFGDDYRLGEKPPKTTMTFKELTKDERVILKEKYHLSDQFIRWLCEPLHKRLPNVLVQHWPFVFLAVYLFDVLLLLAVGKVPLAYNLRNLVVRKVISLMTALAFTVVVGVVVVLLSFVNGMYDLNENSGIPGNVICLSDGSTDELFSNLGYGDVDNIPREQATLDPENYPLEKPVSVKEGKGADGKPTFMMSKEIFFTVNQTIPNPEGGVPKRRFLALRAMMDGELSGPYIRRT